MHPLTLKLFFAYHVTASMSNFHVWEKKTFTVRSTVNVPYDIDVGMKRINTTILPGDEPFTLVICGRYYNVVVQLGNIFLMIYMCFDDIYAKKSGNWETYAIVSSFLQHPRSCKEYQLLSEASEK